MASKTIMSCDIKDCNSEKEVKTVKIQVIFTTEQTEGRSCAPYLSEERFDMCQECENKLLKGNYIFADGAQGYNTYYFKNT
jgi:hypothetical protein